MRKIYLKEVRFIVENISKKIADSYLKKVINLALCIKGLSLRGQIHYKQIDYKYKYISLHIAQIQISIK